MPNHIGALLLQADVHFAYLVDPITTENYHFIRISDNEYQFGKAGDTLTNYVVHDIPGHPPASP